MIVTAIQGITPDARDIASPLAFKMFCPSGQDHHGFCDEDDLPDDVSEAVQHSLAGQLNLQARPARAGCLQPTATLASDNLRDNAAWMRAVEQSLTGPILLHSLCRLTC